MSSDAIFERKESIRLVQHELNNMQLFEFSFNVYLVEYLFIILIDQDAKV